MEILICGGDANEKRTDAYILNWQLLEKIFKK